MAVIKQLPACGVLLAVMLVLCAQSARSQENVQTRIPNWLTECYQTPAIVNRDSRLPSNINILIELVRRFENWPGLNMDMREVASTLVHRFRMDGIERAPGQFVQNVLPFSPSAFQFSKHRVLLSRLVPGSGAQFPNAALTAHERCALHFMLSTSIERQARNDEQNVCNQLAQVRAMRIPRSVAKANNFLGDVELLSEHKRVQATHRRAKAGRMTELDEGELSEAQDEGIVDGDQAVPAADEQPSNVDEALNPVDTPIDFTDDVEIDAGGQQVFGTTPTTLSQCPVENGVLRTIWGAVSGGPLITGIAAGLQPQTVAASQLIALSRAAAHAPHSARQAAQPARVDNRWAATLAGDLAEVALLQGPLTQQVQVGGIGGWNSTSVPRWYFLSQRDRLEMTDAEIRGGLDGLILAMNLPQWRNSASQMRLSQLLDMYYSQRGVFSSNVASCNRRALFTQVAPMVTLRAQTEAFSTVLDREMQMRVTLPQVSIGQFSNSAAQALSTYIPQSLNDPSCVTTSNVPGDRTIWRSAADIYIYIDTTWQYREIQPIIANLVENLDVNPFGSNYTLLNARDGTIIISATNSLSDFYLQWTEAVQQQHASGFSLPDVARSLRAITSILQADDERDGLPVRGALLALIVPHMATVSEADTTFALQEIGILNVEAPDLTLLFFTGGLPTRFERFVRNPSRDLFALVATGGARDNVLLQTRPVIERVQTATRRIINPRCGTNWTQTEPNLSSQTFNQYVERGSLNFYRVLPNYFFQAWEADNRRVRVQGHGYAPITVCTSRLTEWPRQNGTTANATVENDIACRQLLSDSLEIPLRDFCSAHSIIHQCPPLFISVAGGGADAQDSNQQFRCNDRDCRFPDNIRFSISVENLGCFSGVGRLSGGMLMALVAFVLATLWSQVQRG